MKVSKISPQNNFEIVESEIEKKEFDKEIPKERYISPEKRYNGISKNNKFIRQYNKSPPNFKTKG